MMLRPRSPATPATITAIDGDNLGTTRSGHRRSAQTPTPVDITTNTTSPNAIHSNHERRRMAEVCQCFSATHPFRLRIPPKPLRARPRVRLAC